MNTPRYDFMDVGDEEVKLLGDILVREIEKNLKMPAVIQWGQMMLRFCYHEQCHGHGLED